MRLLNEMLTKSDEIGAAINSRLGPDLINNRGGRTKDLWEANFHCNITTPTNLIARFDIDSKTLDPGDTYLYFMCLSGKLKINKMVNYINGLCRDILPFKINVNDVDYIGKFKSSRGYHGNDARDYDIFILKTGINKNINSYYRYALKKYLYGIFKKTYKSNMFNIYYGNTRELSPVLSRIDRKDNTPNINYTSNYFMIVDTLGNLSDKKLLNIHKKIEEELNVSLGDIVKIGELNTTNSKNKATYTLDIFMIEHNEK